MKAVLVQSYRFALVGILSTVCNYGVNMAALAALRLPSAASAIGYLSGVAVGYPLNRKWSFAGAQAEGPKASGAAYLGVYLATFLLNSVMASAAHAHLAAGRPPLFGIPAEYLYYLPVVAVTTVLNFLGCKYLVFKA